MRSGLDRLALAEIEVLDLIAKGEVARDALKMCGIANSTFWLWLERGKAASDENNLYRKFWLKYEISKEAGRRVRKVENQRRKENPLKYDNHTINQLNPRYMDLFSMETQDGIVACLKEGAWLDDAFLANGIEIHVGRFWLELGHRAYVDEKPDEHGFLDFYRRAIIAQGTARSDVAARLLRESPSLWALHGPGRSEGERTGWEKNTKITATVNQDLRIETAWKTTLPPIIEGSSARPLQIDFKPGGAGDIEQEEP